ncbi:glycosyl transferase [Vibrio rotiferianus]|uniref:glycosyltransferase n=1 Tax=Vibrio rotiferianus TaxID=190895 RepID=UPI001110A4F0|nr:glycosyltransferase [Vibrio rotiferianus]TMX44387.1 glycosyl transferase [Vibrio rotiferianus]TMX48782.1 glycosyl transferase [Vibrio rotiferianus]TMX62007.1 glycosyl transferase [Vibrio rotiferianus]
MASSATPLVTVYMPTANRLELLQRAVQSVLTQTYTNIELIIVDDASTDQTWSYLESLQEQHSFVRCFRQAKSQGACSARNVAIQEAKGELITGLDDDDEFTPDRIEQLVQGYDHNFAFVCHGFYWHYGAKSKAVDTQARDISLNDILDYNYASNQILTETVKLRAIGGFDVNFAACQDYDTWTRLIRKFGTAKRIEGASYYLHQGHTGPRVTAKPNKVKGYGQYFDKHQDVMTTRHKANQAFMLRMANQSNYSLFELLSDSRYGFAKRKARYWLSKKLPKIAQIRKNWLRKVGEN